MFLLDTNVLLELRKIDSGKVHAGVLNWAQGQSLTECFVSVMSLAEIERGILALEAKNHEEGGRIKLWFEQSVLKQFEGRIVDVDADAAYAFARMAMSGKAAMNSVWLAATAKARRLTLATMTPEEYAGMDVDILDLTRPSQKE